MNIRPALKSDIPAIDGVLGRSYPRLLKADYSPSVLVTIVPLISKAQPSLIASGTYYLAEADAGAVLGAGGWTHSGAFGERAKSVGHIRHFGTDPGALRQGVARALMGRCFEDAAHAGIKEFACNATLTAVPFYEAMGFRVIKPTEIELRPGILFSAVMMSCKL